MKKLLMLNVMILSLLTIQMRAVKDLEFAQDHQIQSQKNIAIKPKKKPKVVIMTEKFKPEDLKKELSYIRPKKENFFRGVGVFLTGMVTGIFVGFAIFAQLLVGGK